MKKHISKYACGCEEENGYDHDTYSDYMCAKCFVWAHFTPAAKTGINLAADKVRMEVSVK